MLSEQILTKKVVDYLRQNHSIKLNLPNLFRSIDSKVTLKYLKSFPINNNQNRYQILIVRIQQLLQKNLLNLQKIKLFSQDFFNTITQDILILQQNQRLKKKIPSAKQQILIKNQQISHFQKNIKNQCLLINDKQDILDFISHSLKDYLSKLNVIANQYNHVNKFQILTSINIDDLYQDHITDEDDYNKHYLPLLEVLNKLKTNMIKLYQQIQKSDPYDVPLKCVNFLANCKNLIQEMEPFLLKNECAFNRMIFFVVKCQKQNLQLVASNYEKALIFCRQITSDLFKSYYLGFMFKPSYVQIKQQLEQCRQQLLKIINDQQLSQIKLNQLLKQQISRLQRVRQRIKQLKQIISIGKDGIMRNYVSKKQCKKNNLIQIARQQYTILKKMIQKYSQYYRIKKDIQRLQNKQIQQSSKIIKQIKILQKINDIKKLIEQQKLQQKQKITAEKRFQITYVKLQQLILEINTLKIQLQIQLESYHSQKYYQFLIQYLQHRINKLNTINTHYIELQTKLLNTYLTIQAQTQKLQQQSLQTKQNTISKLQNYFNNKLNNNLGFMISNQDNYCQQVKNKILQLGQAQYMIKQWKKDSLPDNSQLQNTKKDQDQIKFYRNNLQWLLIMFQGSMDQKIFQMIMDKLNFESQDYLQKQKKVQQFINQLNKYINDMKKLLKNHPMSQIHPKIYKIIKDRIQLYQIIQDIYTQSLLVFKQVKKKDMQFNIQNKGILLFSQSIFKYVLMIYQFKNKLRMEINQLKELLLPSRTKNYLIDQIYEPFEIRYGQYINYKEEQLLNYTLRLQHSLNIESSQNKIINIFQEQFVKEYNQNYFNNILLLCKEMIQIHQQNTKVLDLQHEPVLIHNLNQFKSLVQPYQEYYLLAQTIHKDLQNHLQTDSVNLKMTKKLQLNNPKTLQLKQIILKRWNQHQKLNNEQLQVKSQSIYGRSKVESIKSRGSKSSKQPSQHGYNFQKSNSITNKIKHSINDQ